jgi:hypothetical protein
MESLNTEVGRKLDEEDVADLAKVFQFISESGKNGTHPILFQVLATLSLLPDAEYSMNVDNCLRILLPINDYDAVAKAVYAIGMYRPAWSHYMLEGALHFIYNPNNVYDISPQFIMGVILGQFEFVEYLDAKWKTSSGYIETFHLKLIDFLALKAESLENVSKDLLDEKYCGRLANAIKKYVTAEGSVYNDTKGKRYAHIYRISKAISNLYRAKKIFSLSFSSFQQLIIEQISYKSFSTMSNEGKNRAIVLVQDEIFDKIKKKK